MSIKELLESCQKGYMTHPTRKTKIMFGKRYRNCVKKEGADTKVTVEQAKQIIGDICVNCGDFSNENLRKWFSDKWVILVKRKKVVDTHHVAQVVRKEDMPNVYQQVKLLV